MDFSFFENRFNLIVFSFAVIYVIIYVAKQLKKRRKIKQLTVVDGVIIGVHKLPVAEYVQEQKVNFEVVVRFEYQNTTYNLSERIAAKLYQHKLNNVLPVYLNTADASQSTIISPYKTSDIIELVFTVLFVIVLILLFFIVAVG